MVDKAVLDKLMTKNRDYLLESLICLNFGEDGRNVQTKKEISFQKEFSDKIRSDFNTSKCMMVDRIGYKENFLLSQLKSAHQLIINSDISNKFKKSFEEFKEHSIVQNVYVQEIFENQIFESCVYYTSNRKFYDIRLQNKIENKIKKINKL